MQRTTSQETADRTDPGLSANFLLVALLVCGLGFAIGGGLVEGSGAAFAFVMTFWVLGLCLHEFGHACVAWWGGDAGVPASGYLSLDPLRYGDPLASIVLPVVFTILGGIGFPGGAVRLDPGALRGRIWPTAVALAGPAMTLACLFGLVVLYHLADADSTALRAVLAVTALFQGTALVLNLMPIPGLDGYNALRPWLPGPWQAVGDAGARHAGLVLTALFLFSGAFSRTLFRVSLRLVAEAGIHPADVVAGYRLIRLW
ncbi:MAG: site-2 protease family protein [Methylobacterium sp.]|uniref:site-2 protease family protein n=1 Tax=Methylobacterium sp. TaxID=409 RepID=UPI00271EC3BB|nr:site-2 protease family protein [Methylobacterium sp.]MDO9427422.1 site-2 protease family protein [Methylobacterium sp.]